MSSGAAAAAPELDARRAASSACFARADFTVVLYAGLQHASGPGASTSSGVAGGGAPMRLSLQALAAHEAPSVYAGLPLCHMPAC
jgi:hypothetical protein